MNHKTLEAKATATDLGEFSAIAAAYSVDRVGDRIIPGAFEGTIKRWQASGKQIPLHWDHEGDPASIIGTVDPNSVSETEAGLMVAGKLDLENSAMAREAWRAMKSGSMGLSFGYMVLDEAKAKDGVTDLKALDVFEFSITPGPANFDTRVLSMKSVKEMTAAEMREEIKAIKARLDELATQLGPEEAQEVTGDESPEVEDAPDEEPTGPTPKASDPEGQREIDELDLIRLQP